MDVTITRVSRGDAEALIEANRQNRQFHAPWASPFIDRAGFDVWYGKILTGPNLGYVARNPQDARLIGVINVTEIVWGAFRSAYLGFYGFEHACRKGLMTNAVAQVSALMFSEIGLHRLEANIQPDNGRSLALVRRIGFIKEGYSRHYLNIGGTWRDHERWALIAP